MVYNDERGKRLLANVIDSYAVNDPNRVWASAPIDNDDISKGFRDISYEEFSNAINHASWWLKETVARTTPMFETIAYAGPKDLRYPILAVAAVKCGNQVCRHVTGLDRADDSCISYFLPHRLLRQKRSPIFCTSLIAVPICMPLLLKRKSTCRLELTQMFALCRSLNCIIGCAKRNHACFPTTNLGRKQNRTHGSFSILLALLVSSMLLYL